MDFFNNLITACKLKSLDPKKIAEACGISKNTFKNWEKGMIPNAEMIVKLSTRINISTDYLLLGKEPQIPTEYKKLISSYQKLSPENQQMALRLMNTMYDVQAENEKRLEIKSITIKLMSNKVSAGKGFSLDGAEGEDIDILATSEAINADFAITVEGDSMLPDYHDGDIVLVKEQKDIEIGQVGIFTINQSEGFIKEYGEDRLISRNPEFKDIFPTDDTIIECKGLVIGIAELAK